MNNRHWNVGYTQWDKHLYIQFRRKVLTIVVYFIIKSSHKHSAVYIYICPRAFTNACIYLKASTYFNPSIPDVDAGE